MRSNDIPLEQLAADAKASAMLQAVRDIASGPLQQQATGIDGGRYPREILQQLGAAGAFRAHLSDAGPAAFGLAIRAMAEISRVCGATGFMTWCQAVCGLYIEQSGNPALMQLLPAHASGVRLGGTGMSNPMKALAGIEPMLLHARPVDGGYIVSGVLPWVSNIAPGHHLGAMAAVRDADGASDDAPARELMFLLHCDAPGVELHACPSFSAMEGTSTWAVHLRDVFIGRDGVIADPAKPFIARIRSAFILLQTGFGLGVAQGAIDSMWQVEPRLGHVNQFLEDRPDSLQAELDALTARIMALSATPFGAERDFMIDVLDTRAHVSELALRAAQSALLHQGARGYLMSSAAQRRVRESHFVAIVTPALKHLRKEIDRLSKRATPGGIGAGT